MGWVVGIVVLASKRTLKMLEIRENRDFIFDLLQDIGLSRHLIVQHFVPGFSRVIALSNSSSNSQAHEMIP